MKPENVSIEQYERNYINAMQAPLSFPSVSAVDIYDGLSRHHLASTLNVEGQWYSDMLSVDQVGLFQKASLESLVSAFGISTEPVKAFLQKKWNMADRKEILLADFLAYINWANETVFKLHPDDNGEVISQAMLEMKGVAVPEHLLKHDSLPVSMVKKYFSAIEQDLKESGRLPSKGKSGIVNTTYRSTASIEEMKHAPDEYVRTGRALFIADPYLSRTTLHQLRNEGKIRHKQQGNAFFYCVEDIQRVVQELKAAPANDISARALEMELLKFVPSHRLSDWRERGWVNYYSLAGLPRISCLEYERIQTVLDKLKAFGIEVREFDESKMFDVAAGGLSFDKKQGKGLFGRAEKKLKDTIDAYFHDIRQYKVLSREVEAATGRKLVSARKDFVSHAISDPRIAGKVARTINSLVNIEDGTRFSSFFSGDGDMKYRKIESLPELTSHISKLEERADSINSMIRKSKGTDKKRLVQEYSGICAKIKQKFEKIGMHDRVLAQIIYRAVSTEKTSDKLLLTKYNDYLSAKHELIQGILKLAAFWAIKHARKKGEFDFYHRLADCISIANIGAIDGAERWNPELGYKLSTYATWWIRQALHRYHHERIGLAETQTMRDIVYQYRRERRSYLLAHCREPTGPELAKRMGTTIDKIGQIRHWATGFASLDAAVQSDEDTLLGEFIGKDDPGYDKKLEGIDNQKIAEILENTLTPRQLRIIKARFFEGKSLEAVGAELNLTRERIRQIEAKTLEKLRVKEHGLEKFVPVVI